MTTITKEESLCVVPERRPVVAVRNLDLTFAAADGPERALANIGLEVAQGEFISLIGPSGCGKTSLLRTIAGLLQPTAGEILVNGLAPADARQQRFYGYVFQAPGLLAWRTVLQNVMLPLEIMKIPRKQRAARAREVLEAVGLSDSVRKFPWQLSGGMQQRVSIARALSFSPKLLLMDEPFGALDEITRDNLNLHLAQLWSKSNLTVIFVTHSIPEAVFLSSRIAVMSAHPGRIAEIIDCGLPRRRDLALRDTPRFHSLTARVRESLRRSHSYESP
jgi:NitT/TauT family transport system ATP-binding protein